MQRTGWHDRGVSRLYSSSGVVGLAGRLPAVDHEPVRSSSLVLDGRPLTLAGRAHLYTCGITPYDVTHLGHAATFVWADLVVTLCRAAGVEPVTCRNVTDVDDVLTAAASRAGSRYDELAVTQEFLFDRDMRALAVAAPTHSPRARSHVDDVVQLAAALLATGDAYERDGHVFFRGERVLRDSGLGEDEATSLAREFGDHAADDGREHRFDVPVWRPSPEEHPAWPSPWGWGRPGWHAECAAMAWATCGSSIDLLVGGADLTFPHHAFQTAMVEAATGVAPFARRLLHVGEVRHDGAKMAKSTGNLVLVGDLLTRHRGAAVRLMLLNRPCREAWEYDEGQLAAAGELLDRLYAAAATPSGAPAGAPATATGSDAGVLDALLDELDVPAAVDLALEHGGAAAGALIHLLKLGEAGR